MKESEIEVQEGTDEAVAQAAPDPAPQAASEPQGEAVPETKATDPEVEENVPQEPETTTPEEIGVEDPKAEESEADEPLTQGEFARHIEELRDLFYRTRLGSNIRLNQYKGDTVAPHKGFEDVIPTLTTKELSQFLIVSEDSQRKLKSEHQRFIDELPARAPRGVFKGTGVVYVAGKRYMPTMLVSLQMLRRYSPHIPVEVIMGSREEYEPELCERVLPELGAKCLILEDILGKDFMLDFDIHGYQVKTLGILVSSFDNVIFIDSDNMPLRNVEQLVHQEPYVSTKYVIWPDVWYRTTSPAYYDIAGLELGDRVRGDLEMTDTSESPLHDLQGAIPDSSSESGQLAVSKNAHYRDLLLATYYNLYGFDIYYPLLTQGGPGQGDKETFIAAAHALNSTVYQIHGRPRVTGRFDPEFSMAGLLQCIPNDDYKKYVTETRQERPRIMFAHINMQKLNLREVIQGFPQAMEIDAPPDTRVRLFGKPSQNYETFDYSDIELYMWQGVKWTACDMYREYGVTPQDWDNLDMQHMCQVAEAQLDWLVETHMW